MDCVKLAKGMCMDDRAQRTRDGERRLVHGTSASSGVRAPTESANVFRVVQTRGASTRVAPSAPQNRSFAP